MGRNYVVEINFGVMLSTSHFGFVFVFVVVFLL